MRAGTVVLAGLLVWTIASAARSYSRAPGQADNPAAALGADTPVPAPVMSALRSACFDCHSNETRWPWYSSLPMVSWLIEHDVSEGRAQLNFSSWKEYTTFERVDLLDKVCDQATKREMPLWQYRLLHRVSRLNGLDLAMLCAWTTNEATRLAGEAAGRSEGWQIPEGAEREGNPVAVNAAVIASGQRLYKSKCQRCHGLDGTGSGPDADPDHTPGNLTDAARAARNPDGVMFYKIWNGRTKPKMPPMKAELDPADVWTVIHYVKTLRRADVPPHASANPQPTLEARNIRADGAIR